MLVKAAVVQFVQLTSFIAYVGIINSGARRTFVQQPILPEDMLFRKSSQNVRGSAADQLTFIEATGFGSPWTSPVTVPLEVFST